LATLLISCGRTNLADLAPPLRVDQPTTCEDILAKLDLPKFGRDHDAVEAYLTMEAVAMYGAAQIELARECLVRQRLDYAGKEKN
jgi:hypothetical protein